MKLTLWIWIFTALFLASDVFSQVELATCPTTDDWAYNSLNQSVCSVASNLAAVCNSRRVYTIPALSNPGDRYGGPPSQDDCRCNTVFYSLLSACALCQGYQYVTWTVFTANCTDPTVGSYLEDIPEGTAVFDWAYAGLSVNDDFNQTLATSSSDAAESTHIPSPTSTLPSAPSTVSATAPVTGEDNKSSSKAGAIAGGVVGGLAFIAIVTASVFWLLSRRRIRRTQEVHTKEDSQAMTDYSSPFVYGGYTPATTPSVLPLYNPSDPSTFPSTPAPPSTIYTTQPSDAFSVIDRRSHLAPSVSYSGAAEI